MEYFHNFFSFETGLLLKSSVFSLHSSVLSLGSWVLNEEKCISIVKTV